MKKVLIQGIKKNRKLKNELMAAAEGIQKEFPKANVSVTIKPESLKKEQYKLSFLIRMFQHELLISRRDGRLYPMIHEAKHDVINKLHRLKEKIFNRRIHITPKEVS